MRKTFGVLSLAAVLAVPGAAEAQISVGPTAAFHDDFDFGIGAMVGVDLPALAPGVGVLGDFTYFFPGIDNFDYWEINGNLTYDIVLEDAPVAPFALGGLNVASFSSSADTEFGSFSASSTEIGINLGGGIKFQAGALEPLVGLRLELNGGEGFVIFGSLPFSVGG